MSIKKKNKMTYKEILDLARKLRKTHTPYEQIIWNILHNRKLDGIKFLRQHPIIYDMSKKELFFFITDFYCCEYKLAIEIDGKIHDFQKEHDKNRDMIIKDKDINVLRIKNEEIEDIEKVKIKIRKQFIKD